MGIVGVGAGAEAGDSLVDDGRACSASPGTTGTPGARCPLDHEAVGIAAATERTVCSGCDPEWPTSPSRASMSCGLTAITTSAAPATASSFEEGGVDPVALARARSPRSRASARRDDVAGFAPPDESSPEMSASPILPVPSTAIRRSSMSREV